MAQKNSSFQCKLYSYQCKLYSFQWKLKFSPANRGKLLRHSWKLSPPLVEIITLIVQIIIYNNLNYHPDNFHPLRNGVRVFPCWGENRYFAGDYHSVFLVSTSSHKLLIHEGKACRDARCARFFCAGRNDFFGTSEKKCLQALAVPKMLLTFAV